MSESSSDRMIRVDQAGEYGATRIYAGQLAVMGERTRHSTEIRAMAAQEADHLKRFDALVARRGTRPSALQPLWSVAGYALGAATALIGPEAAILSIHSFTPAWKGMARPWEVGVLWDKDRRLAGPLMSRLSQHAFIWGDNEPYSGALENDCLNRHGTRRGLPHALVEIRQDLIGTDADAESFAHKLAFVLEAALADMERAR